MLRERPSLGAADIRSALRIAGNEPGADVKSVLADAISVPSRRRFITPKTANQKRYLEAVRGHDLVIAIGPAGTGKSYLAVAMAISALLKREVARIVLTRPAVEAGERLGFLPGDLVEKVHPYLRPLYDALYDMLEPEKVSALSEKGAIEIAPLAYMRGRTLNDAFIILDEAQNTTSEQMKMFLTRLGFNSKMVVTGDITQVDLPAEPPVGPDRGADGAAGDRRHPLHLLRRPRRRAPRPRLLHRARLRSGPEAVVARSGLRSGPAVPVAVSNLQRKTRVSPERLRTVARRALTALGRADREVHVTVVDDRRIRALNTRYLGIRASHRRARVRPGRPRPGPALGRGDRVGGDGGAPGATARGAAGHRAGPAGRARAAAPGRLRRSRAAPALAGCTSARARSWPAGRRARSRRGSGPGSSRPDGVAASGGLRGPRRTAQRGQVHAAQPPGRREDGHRLAAPPDDAHPHHRDPPPARRPDRLRGHPGPARGGGAPRPVHVQDGRPRGGGRRPRLLRGGGDRGPGAPRPRRARPAQGLPARRSTAA